ncbi:MAG: TPM domain-containing protein [Bacteroidales bacterium]|jgi:uncharacterized protein
MKYYCIAFRQFIKNVFSIGFLALGFILFSFNSYSQDDIPDAPKQQRLVNDFANFLNPDEQNSLERKLVAFDDSTSTQIAIVIVKDLNGYEIADYTNRLTEKWKKEGKGIGQKEKDNGILILIKPKNNNERGEVNISTGYGLEGIIPDAICKRIVENEIIPNFKENKYYEGLDAATNVLMSLAKKEFSASDYSKKHEIIVSQNKSWVPFIIIALAFLFFGIFRIAGAHSYARTNNLTFWVAFWLLMSSSSRGGSYNNFSSGGGFFGGGGGFGGSGGFGGFGGGSFGGGGASGSW